jgi:hypothetical protein
VKKSGNGGDRFSLLEPSLNKSIYFIIKLMLPFINGKLKFSNVEVGWVLAYAMAVLLKKMDFSFNTTISPSMEHILYPQMDTHGHIKTQIKTQKQIVESLSKQEMLLRLSLTSL